MVVVVVEIFKTHLLLLIFYNLQLEFKPHEERGTMFVLFFTVFLASTTVIGI